MTNRYWKNRQIYTQSAFSGQTCTNYDVLILERQLGARISSIASDGVNVMKDVHSMACDGYCKMLHLLLLLMSSARSDV